VIIIADKPSCLSAIVTFIG